MTISSKAIYILITVVCCNAFSVMLYSSGVEMPVVEPSFNVTQFIEITDVNETLRNYDYSVPYSDFPFGVLNFISTLWDLVFWGYPKLLLGFGMPSAITWALFAPYGLMWMLVIILNWIAGRDV
jgi:hypothetical protein